MGPRHAHPLRGFRVAPVPASPLLTSTARADLTEVRDGTKNRALRSEQRTWVACSLSMAIDVLSDPGTAPIIVGDAADMSDLQAVTSDSEGRFHLRLDGYEVALSSPASDNFRLAKHLLLVSLDGDQVLAARRVRLDNIEDGKDLSADQCEALAKALTLTSDPESREFYNAAIADFKSRYPDLAAA